MEEKRIEDLTVEEARELLRRQKVRPGPGFLFDTTTNPITQAQPPAARQVKSEETEPNLKRERASTATTNARPLKISRTSDGQEYVDLASESDDGDVKDEGKILGTDTKKADAKIEVIDLLD